MFLAVLRFQYWLSGSLEDWASVEDNGLSFSGQTPDTSSSGNQSELIHTRFLEGQEEKGPPAGTVPWDVLLATETICLLTLLKHTLKSLTMIGKQFSDFKYILEEINYAREREREGETQWNPSVLNSNPNEALSSIVRDLFSLQVTYTMHLLLNI